jgi:hypothetical protein
VGFDSQEPQQRQLLATAMKIAGIATSEVWLKYFSLGGEAAEYEVHAYIEGLLSLPLVQRDLHAMAANELTTRTPKGQAPYANEISPGS